MSSGLVPYSSPLGGQFAVPHELPLGGRGGRQSTGKTMTPSPMQLLVIALIVILLFGASRLGEVGKGLGDGIRNFKKGVAGDDDDKPDQLKAERPTIDTEGEEKKADKHA